MFQVNAQTSQIRHRRAVDLRYQVVDLADDKRALLKQFRLSQGWSRGIQRIFELG
jgi:hypothetical protein